MDFFAANFSLPAGLGFSFLVSRSHRGRGRCKAELRASARDAAAGGAASLISCHIGRRSVWFFENEHDRFGVGLSHSGQVCAAAAAGLVRVLLVAFWLDWGQQAEQRS